MVDIIIYLESQLLCIEQLCHRVVIGCPATPTPVGEFIVDKILLNPKPISPYGKPYPAAKLGGTVITFTNTNFAIHGWDDQSIFKADSNACSFGCVRVPQSLLKDLVYKYYFNKIIIE